jgi:hypothetical protein
VRDLYIGTLQAQIGHALPTAVLEETTERDGTKDRKKTRSSGGPTARVEGQYNLRAATTAEFKRPPGRERCFATGKREGESCWRWIAPGELLGRRRRRYPSLDAFASLAAPTEAKRPTGSTLRPLHCKTKAYDEVAPSPVLVQPGGPRGIRPIVTGPAQLSVLRAQFVMAFL